MVKFANNGKFNFIISNKLDGLSAQLYKKNDKMYLYTRGNGYEGSDITHLIKYIFDK